MSYYHHNNHPYNPPYPSPSEPFVSRKTPSPAPNISSPSSFPLHLQFPSPSNQKTSASNSNSISISSVCCDTPHANYLSQQQRLTYPTSSPYLTQQHQQQQQHHRSTPDLPLVRPFPSTTSFVNGYASPAPSVYSSEPSSRDELEPMEPGALGTTGTTAGFHGHYHAHPPTLPGVDDILSPSPSHSDTMYIDSYSPSAANGTATPPRPRWSMRDFQLMQTVGTGTFGRVFLARFSQPRPNYPEFFALKVLLSCYPIF
jgi:hypothetical protein